MTSMKMRAAVLSAYGSALQVGPILRPETAEGQVLVRVGASGVNPLDLKISKGQAPHARHSPPAILGIDVAGVVENVGAGVTSFKPGDEVYGMTGGVGGLQGSLAEFVAADVSLLAPKPKNIGTREAAALPLIFITAWEGLVDRAHVSGGQKVLVHGGAGGVGHMAVQLARASDAAVFATGSLEDKAYIEHLGATFIDYKETPVD
ncbi:MAG: alcohol dehydrogenase catalytic domain-containing protein, partial [Bradyrhizobium sp.]